MGYSRYSVPLWLPIMAYASGCGKQDCVHLLLLWTSVFPPQSLLLFLLLPSLTCFHNFHNFFLSTYVYIPSSSTGVISMYYIRSEIPPWKANSLCFLTCILPVRLPSHSSPRYFLATAYSYTTYRAVLWIVISYRVICPFTHASGTVKRKP